MHRPSVSPHLGIKKRVGKRRQPLTRCLPHVEALEDRSLLSAFIAGSINGQDGWSGGGTIPIDATVDQGIDQSGLHAHSGVGSWRVSNSTINGNHNGAFGGWPFGPGLGVSAGQPSSGAGADRFSATYFFRSASTVADGSNIEVDLGTTSGDDRNTFMAITNRANADGGLQLRMAEPNPADPGNDFFFPTQIVATNITRGTWHRIDIQAKFIDGPSNDTFQVSLDGVAIMNPTPGSPNNGSTNWGTFEGYRDPQGFAYAQSNRMYWRSGAAPSVYGAFSDTAAHGFYFDDVSYKDWNSATPATILASYAANFDPAPTTVYVNQQWAGTPAGADPDGAGPATSFGYDAFTTIQAGVNAVQAGGTVYVAPGTYAENVVIPKAVQLLGANAGINPNTGVRGAETIVEPGLTSSFDADSVIVVKASNVTIDGLKIQGSIANPPGGQSAGFTLTSGTTVYAAAGISNSTNVNTGGSAPSTIDISGLTVQNDIIKDFTQVGVYGDTSAGTPSTGNTITANRIQDIPNNGQGGYFGEGVIIYDNFYATVTANTIASARTGIQTGNNYLSAGAFSPSISDNRVSAYVKGVYFNLQYAAASTFTVSGNTITQADATVSPVYNVGLLIQSIQSSVQSVIQGNNVSGFRYGVEFAGNNTTNTVTLQGGTLNNNTYGVWDTNNDYFYPAPYATTAALSGVSITNSKKAGIWVDSTSANSAAQYDTTDNTSLAITNATSVTGGPVGLLVAGAHSSITGTTLNNTAFSGQSGNYITLASGALVSQTIDATAATFGGLTGATATLAQNFAIEDKITHAVDDGTLGFVRVEAGNVFVTPSSFVSPATTPSIERAVLVASNGDTVNVQTGTYTGDVNASGQTLTFNIGSTPATYFKDGSAAAGRVFSSLAPGTVVNQGNLTLGGNDTLIFHVSSTNPFNQHDEWIVKGTVTLNDAHLVTTPFVTAGGVIGPNTALVLIQNDKTDAVSGTFFNQPEPSTVVVNGVTYNITYHYNAELATYGNGNDVALFVPAPSPGPVPFKGLSGNDVLIPQLQPGGGKSAAPPGVAAPQGAVPTAALPPGSASVNPALPLALGSAQLGITPLSASTLNPTQAAPRTAPPQAGHPAESSEADAGLFAEEVTAAALDRVFARMA